MIRKNRQYSSTRVLFNSRLCRVTLHIQGGHSPRARRTFALALIRELSPALRAIANPKILHEDAHWSQWIHAENRETSLKQAPCIGDSDGQLGFAIRMRRLEIGLSQESLSKAAGITAAYLSQIEKGRHRPRLDTLRRIEAALGRRPGPDHGPDHGPGPLPVNEELP
jgi:DNA-binding XRE family transcriptional regulator